MLSPRFAAEFAVLLLLAVSTMWAGDADRHYKRGLKAEKSGKMLEAVAHYSRARAAAPSDERFIRASQRVQASRALGLSALGLASQPASEPHLSDESQDALNRIQAVERVDPSADLASAVRLEPERVITAIRFSGTTREAYEHLAERFGLSAMFDEDYSSEKQVRLNLDDVDFRDAVIALNDAASAIVVPIHSTLFLVAEDTPNKRAELEPMVAVNIPLPNAATPEAVNELTQAVKQALDIKRVFFSVSQSQLTVRDTLFKVRLAQAIVDRMMQPSAEVLLEVHLISYNRESNLDLGVSLPNSFPVANFSTLFNAQPPESGAAPLIGLGGGETVFGVGVADAAVTASLQRGEGNSLQTMRLRATSGSQANLRIGERFPIVNTRFESVVVLDENDPLVRNPIPNITFEDLGLNLTVTPIVHSGREVTLQIEAEFQLLAGGAVNGIPILSNRSLQSQVRLEEGQAAIVAGMGVATKSTTGQGLAGLGELPLIGRFFRDNTGRVSVSDLLLVVRPRVVRLPASDTVRDLTVVYGPEQRPLPAL